MNCLLIDDDLDDQEIFCLALLEVNPDITCMLAKDGREGLEKLKLLNGPVHDYIFIDLNMPRMNGIETLQEINKMNFLNNTNIIIYSTTSNQTIIDDAISKGADGFLVKPGSLKELVHRLRETFGHQTTK